MLAISLTGPTLIAFIVVSTAVSVVMLADVIRLRVPNTAWVLFGIGGLLFHLLSPLGRGLEFSLVGMFLGFGLLFMPFLAGGIAARDVKLTAGVGAWLGPSLTIWVFVCIAVVAALYLTLAYSERNNLQNSIMRLRILYYRLASLLRYLATDEGGANGPATELDERLVSYTTAIFVSTLFFLGFLIFWS